MIKAKENGKWMGQAPMGYINYSFPDGSKGIIRKEPEATIIKRAFEELENKTNNVKEIYRMAINSGLACSYSNFFNVLKNPVYAGSIRIMRNNGESDTVHGQHIGIISTATFNKVQQLFTSEHKKYRISFNANFPLRGFIDCPRCGKD